MISFKNPKTAQIPSASGMPAWSPAHNAALGMTSVCPTALATSVVRDRQAVIGTDLGTVQGYFPGTPAWRPPIC